MSLRKEVLHRLLLAKSILSPARNAILGQPNAHLVARQVLNAHDAADLIFAAIADHQGMLPPKSRSPSMLKCLELVSSSENKHAGYFNGLSDARDSLKHIGNLPNTTQWARVGEETFEKLSGICQATLGTTLEGVDEIELLGSDEIKGYLFAAKRFGASQEFKAALEEVGKALCVSLDEHPDLWEIAVGRAKAEDALKLTGFGISANDFLRLQEFLPRVSRVTSEPFKILWTQSKLGHPGNWRADIVDFCSNTCLEVILSIQTASGAPFAVEFGYAYDYSVTAKEDNVEVWEDLVEGHLDDFCVGCPRPFKEHRRYLKAGESITVSAIIQPLVSDDRSPEGEEIKRVRVSADMYALLFPPGRADFVNFSQVEIKCVPRNSESFRAEFRDLPEIPWHEDPPD
jgi:hypothetical protein